MFKKAFSTLLHHLLPYTSLSRSDDGADLTLSKRLYTPSVFHFFVSRYFILVIFTSIFVHGILHTVILRRPISSTLRTKLLLRFPTILYLYITTVTLLYHFSNHYSLPLARTGKSEADTLWSAFKAISLSCIVDVFSDCIENRDRSEPQSMTLLEWAITLYFTASSSNREHSQINHGIVVAILHLSQLLTFHIMKFINPALDRYRLIPSSIFGAIGLLHFLFAMSRAEDYPLIPFTIRILELLVLTVIAIFTLVRLVTLLIVGGAGCPHPLFDRRSLPRWHEDYGLAVFRLGNACVESGSGTYSNELTAVVMPVSRAETGRHTGRSGKGPFATLVPDRVPTGRQRMQMRKRARYVTIKMFLFNCMKAFMRSMEWLWYRARRRRRSGEMERYVDMPLTAENKSVDEDGEELYMRFLGGDLSETEMEDSEEYFPPSPSISDSEEEVEGEEEEEREEAGCNSNCEGTELENNAILMSSEAAGLMEDMVQFDRDRDIPVLLPLPLFFLTHYLTFGTLTRRRFNRLLSTDAPLTNSDESQENGKNSNEKDDTDWRCVVCQSAERCILLRPCFCLALCDECRERMARRKYKSCPTCRREVEGYSRVYVP
ncbi:uncharacterized protein VTP21DRAFT_8376 [Calcarisporiella thermophila]|uniref:uncharacterized protein n=1 Tax=Calcarisporiella thermophila TaxID=911321 RepID=UPI0037430B15